MLAKAKSSDKTMDISDCQGSPESTVKACKDTEVSRADEIAAFCYKYSRLNFVDAKVKDIRHIVPLMLMEAHPEKYGYFARKVKGIWDKKPEDWPEDVPFVDPNNKLKNSGADATSKPTKETCQKMLQYLYSKLQDRNVKTYDTHNSPSRLLEQAQVSNEVLATFGNASAGTSQVKFEATGQGDMQAEASTAVQNLCDDFSEFLGDFDIVSFVDPEGSSFTQRIFPTKFEQPKDENLQTYEQGQYSNLTMQVSQEQIGNYMVPQNGSVGSQANDVGAQVTGAESFGSIASDCIEQLDIKSCLSPESSTNMIDLHYKGSLMVMCGNTEPSMVQVCQVSEGLKSQCVAQGSIFSTVTSTTPTSMLNPVDKLSNPPQVSHSMSSLLTNYEMNATSLGTAVPDADSEMKLTSESKVSNMPVMQARTVVADFLNCLLSLGDQELEAHPVAQMCLKMQRNDQYKNSNRSVIAETVSWKDALAGSVITSVVQNGIQGAENSTMGSSRDGYLQSVPKNAMQNITSTSTLLPDNGVTYSTSQTSVVSGPAHSLISSAKANKTLVDSCQSDAGLNIKTRIGLPANVLLGVAPTKNATMPKIQMSDTINKPEQELASKSAGVISIGFIGGIDQQNSISLGLTEDEQSNMRINDSMMIPQSVEDRSVLSSGEPSSSLSSGIADDPQSIMSYSSVDLCDVQETLPQQAVDWKQHSMDRVNNSDAGNFAQQQVMANKEQYQNPEYKVVAPNMTVSYTVENFEYFANLPSLTTSEPMADIDMINPTLLTSSADMAKNTVSPEVATTGTNATLWKVGRPSDICSQVAGQAVSQCHSLLNPSTKGISLQISNPHVQNFISSIPSSCVTDISVQNSLAGAVIPGLASGLVSATSGLLGSNGSDAISSIAAEEQRSSRGLSAFQQQQLSEKSYFIVTGPVTSSNQYEGFSRILPPAIDGDAKADVRHPLAGQARAHAGGTSRMLARSLNLRVPLPVNEKEIESQTSPKQRAAGIGDKRKYIDETGGGSSSVKIRNTQVMIGQTIPLFVEHLSVDDTAPSKYENSYQHPKRAKC